MSWYRTGTVAVTNGSKTVTGVGTLWTTAVNAGDAFALVDANLNPTGAWYEVDVVVSNTEITLKQSYAGTTGSNNQYCVFNMVGNMTTPSFAQRLATFFASFQSLIDKPTVTPTAASIPVADANGDIDSGWIKDASATVKGVVKVGNSLSSASGVLSVELATPEEVATGLDTYRVPTPAGLVRIRSNQNILHNWDFRNPVNQRGASSYVNNVYTVDRWKTVDGGAAGVVTVTTGAVTLYRLAAYVGLCQYIDNPARYSGLTVTLSAIIKGTGTFRIYADGVSYGLITITDEAEYTLKQATFTLPTITSELYVHFSSGNGGTLYIQRVKLELGKVSTLENDPPMDYGQELLTCQRYYYQSVSGGAPFIYRTKNLSDGTSSIPYFIQYHFPVQMRIAPTVEVTYDINDAAPVTAAGYAVTTVSGSIAGDLPAGQHLDINKIVASADL